MKGGLWEAIRVGKVIQVESHEGLGPDRRHLVRRRSVHPDVRLLDCSTVRNKEVAKGPDSGNQRQAGGRAGPGLA